MRIRVPDWLEGLENEIKTRASKKLGRGNVTVGLRLGRAEDCKGQLQINAAAMESMLAAIAATQAQAAQVGLQLAPVRATDILQMRGVLEQATAENESEHLVKVFLSEFDSLLPRSVRVLEPRDPHLRRRCCSSRARDWLGAFL